ncbi:hypothetical protein MP228_004025 [Amoeboaphelidium protococcarum]|nr:hypothetical protein MP228_004025 [Amoeboaphelidium protococcarum]
MAESNELYGQKEYWERRYEEEDTEQSFDWFKTYDDIRDSLGEFIKDKESRIIILGCGNSTLGYDMIEDGYTHIVNVDYAANVIDQMQQKYNKLVQDKHPDAICSFEQADVTQMKCYDDATFDVAIDKGTLDAMLCGKYDPWNPPKDKLEKAHGEIAEVYRILKRGAVFLYITFGQKHFRLPILQTQPWSSVQALTLTDNNKQQGGIIEYFLYVMIK